MPKLVAFHHGDTVKAGHFVALDVQSNIVYDAGLLRAYNPTKDNHVCMVVMEKI